MYEPVTTSAVSQMFLQCFPKASQLFSQMLFQCLSATVPVFVSVHFSSVSYTVFSTILVNAILVFFQRLAKCVHKASQLMFNGFPEGVAWLHKSCSRTFPRVLYGFPNVFSKALKRLAQYFYKVKIHWESLGTTLVKLENSLEHTAHAM